MQQPNLITPHFIEYDGWDSGQGFLGIIEVFALMTQPSCQLMHDFFEDHAVNILAQHVKKEPITHLKNTIVLNRMAPAGISLDYLALLDEGVDHFSFDQSESV